MALGSRSARAGLGAVVGAAALAAVLAGCTSHAGSASGVARSGVAAAASAPSGVAAKDSAGGISADDAAGGVRSAATEDAVPLAPARVVTAQLTVAVRRAAQVAVQADRADAIAAGVAGEVDSDDRSGGKDARATLLLRVPPARLASVLRDLAGLGIERSQSSSSTDVTGRVADVGARVGNARAEIARLRTLYQRAAKVSDVLAVESDLSDREADLESLEAQQRALAQQTALATVTVTFETAAAPAPAPVRHRNEYAGFAGGLRRGSDAFLAFARGVGAAIGASWPFILIALGLGAGARFGARRRPGRQRPAPEA